MKILTENGELLGEPTPNATPLETIKRMVSHRVNMQSVLSNPPEPLIESVLDKGTLSVIAGESGSGKTWLIMDMGVAIASGQDWLDKKSIKSTVGYIDEEMGEWGWYSRLDMIQHGRHLQDNHDWDINVLFFSEIDLMTATGESQLKYHITSNSLDVLFIDSLSGMHLGNENDTANMTIVMNSLLRTAKTTGCAIVVLHHTKKSDGDYRGSSLIRNKTDNLYMFELKTKPDVELWTNKRRYGADFTLQAKHVWDRGSYSMLPTEKRMGATEPIPTKKSLAINVIRDIAHNTTEPLTNTDLLTAVAREHPDVSEATAQKAIKKMIEQRELFKDKDNHYYVE